ncbi:hypothetical protein ENU1_127240 [Entamoeba nuttalli P19]|uniref:Uncharacterized protein n=2 Tax=Entamoeba nuttalli TaxID=412467 RepID=K2HA46_ENTNP|nr:hypothetical protein ENU1_127240 [Entamoeba nuttalli P19]EKE39459.1 hypothetical protein ENU1_127240 [Entamoeba nuttalli P19]|eukprot:XP_008858205.1 hypothetical protein ENU1_127240 [Entamoeba nuttalli P19]
MSCFHYKMCSHKSWSLISLWSSLILFEFLLIILSIISFFSLVGGVVDFKARNDLNFNLIDTYSIAQTELTPPKNSTSIFSAFSDYLETHFLTFLRTKGIWKGKCIPNVKFFGPKIQECIKSYCNEHSNEDSCKSFISSNGVNIVPMVFEHFHCVIDLYIENNSSSTIVPITVDSIPSSMQFTTSITEAQRLIMVYKVPLWMTFDECTIRPLISSTENVIQSDSATREIALTQAGKYLATPTLKATGRIKNVIIVGWNQDLLGFIVKESKGEGFGQSKMYWEGDRSELDDFNKCGGVGFWYWKPEDPRNITSPTKLNIKMSICEKYYGKNNCPFVENENYYIRSDSDGRPFIDCVNSVFGMFDVELMNGAGSIFKLTNFTITMLENMFDPALSNKGTADCGYSLMTYDVLRDYFEIHKNTGETPVGFTRIDFSYSYDKEGSNKLWNICA